MAYSKKSGHRKRVPLPKLCVGDQVLYILLMVLCVAVILAPLVVGLLVQEHLVLRSGEVIAYEASMWLLLVFLPMLTCVVPLGLLIDRYRNRIPIVGPKWTASGAVGSKGKSKKRPVRRDVWLAVAVWSTVWLVTLVMAIGVLCARSEITATEVRAYTLFGEEIHRAPLSDVVATELEIYYSPGGKTSPGYWAASYTVVLRDGESYEFEPNPMVLLEIDEHIPPCPRTVEGVEHFEDLCLEHDLSPEEAARLRPLFGVEDG